MDIESKILKYYNNYQGNKNKLKIGDWIVIDEPYYTKYKDNIKITNIKIYSGKNEYSLKEEKYILADTKEYYILIKYSTNFIAVNIAEREYEVLKTINLVMINSNSISNIENKVDKPLKIKELFKLLGWKATNRAIRDYEDFGFI